MTEEKPAGALSDLLVLDFTTLLPGPLATLILADAGAEVIKIERPGKGEEIRSYVPRWRDDAINHAMLNRGKKGIALDLKDPQERAKLAPLLARADVLVEQFRPGVMERLGLGYEAVKAIKPDIVYCSISGYGQDGPKRLRAGHDMNYIGNAGLLSLSHGPLERPTIPPALIADIAGGSYPAVMNILMALRARDAGGGGCYLDIAMAENVFPFTFWALGAGQLGDGWPGNAEGQLAGGSPRYRCYPTADGRLLAAAPLEQKFWEAFCAAIGLDPALRDDSRDPEATAAGIAALIAARPAAHWQAVFAEADCCCSIVQSLEEAMADPHFAARGVFARALTNRQGDRLRALPLPVVPALRGGSGAPEAAPELGEHNALLDKSAP